MAMVTAGATAARGRILGPHEMVALVSPGVEAALAERGLGLVQLEARGGSWEVPDGTVVSDVQLGDGSLNLAALDVTVTLVASGRSLGTRGLRLTAVAEAPVLVTSGELRAGDRLAGNTVLGRQRLDGPTVAYLLPAPAGEELGRLVARRPLRPGTVIRAADVRRQQALAPGQTVTAAAEPGALPIESTVRPFTGGGHSGTVAVRVLAHHQASRDA